MSANFARLPRGSAAVIVAASLGIIPPDRVADYPELRYMGSPQGFQDAALLQSDAKEKYVDC
jgi:hypothetical protein